MSGIIPYLWEVISNVNYSRPDYITKSSASTESSTGSPIESPTESRVDLTQTPSKGSGKYSQGIPDALSFDNIINGGTCPPMTVREFMNFLEFVEHAPENLQFFLWFRDYKLRFERPRPPNPFSTPPATATSEDQGFALSEYQNDLAARFPNEAEDEQPINQPKSVMNPEAQFIVPWEAGVDKEELPSKEAPSSAQASYRESAKQVFVRAGVKVPDSNLPYRDEIDRIIAIYVADDGSRQLNLASRQRKTLIERLSTTTHPDAFLPIIKTVEYGLRHQAHPNFIRWSICNGNKPRQVFAKGLGVALIIFGFLYAILTTLSKMSRGWRAFSAMFWVLGASTLYAALRGMCVVLHGLHHRHLRPWELWESEGPSMIMEDAFGGEKNEKNEEYPWVKKYEKRFIIRKIFDREVWVQEPALRQIQDIIFLQSLLTGFAVASVFTIIFLAVPGGRFF